MRESSLFRTLRRYRCIFQLPVLLLTVVMCLAAETLIDKPAVLAALLGVAAVCLWAGRE